MNKKISWIKIEYENGDFEHTNDINLFEPYAILKDENKNLKEQFDYALKTLAEINPPCEFDGFMDKYIDYCSSSCSNDEEVFKKCWKIYIYDKLQKCDKKCKKACKSVMGENR